MSDLIMRVDGRTGKRAWHTLKEWNIINGYEEDTENILQVLKENNFPSIHRKIVLCCGEAHAPGDRCSVCGRRSY